MGLFATSASLRLKLRWVRLVTVYQSLSRTRHQSRRSLQGLSSGISARHPVAASIRSGRRPAKGCRHGEPARRRRGPRSRIGSSRAGVCRTSEIATGRPVQTWKTSPARPRSAASRAGANRIADIGEVAHRIQIADLDRRRCEARFRTCDLAGEGRSDEVGRPPRSGEVEETDPNRGQAPAGMVLGGQEILSGLGGAVG